MSAPSKARCYVQTKLPPVVWVEAGDLSLGNGALGLGLEKQWCNGRWWRNRGDNSSGVCILCKSIGNHGIGGLPKDLPDSMMPRLVEHIGSRVIGEVDHRLMWGMEPSKGIAIMS